MEQLVLLLVIGLISLINWAMQKSAEARERRKLERARRQDGSAELEPAREPAPAGETAADPAESMRKLMEALGLPVEEEPPARPAPKAPPPLIAEFPPDATESQPNAPEAPPPASPFVPPLPPPVPLRAFPAPKPPPSRSAPQPRAPVAPSRLRELLTTQSGLRSAIVAAEVLGRPKGLG